ncbi:MAG: DUF2934 domain-containing protein [Terriglobales bacterium]
MPKAKTPRVTTPPNKQVLTMPEVTSTAPVRKASSSATSATADLETQIRQRAYELYQERGCTPGLENEDWLQAERELLGRQNQRQSA